MNTLIAPQRTDRRRADLPAPLSQHPLSHRTPRTSLADRIALRLALALLLWSTRPNAVVDAHTRREAKERDLREDAWRCRWHSLPLA